MLIAYKYKFWEALAKVAPSEEEQKRLLFKLSTDLKISERKLKNYLNIKASDAADIPGSVLLWLSARLDISPAKAVNYKLPVRTMLDEMTDANNVKKRFNLSKPSKRC